MKNNHPQGQIGLLLLVIIGVVVAIVLSVASRSLSDTVLSRQSRESSAAFSVAETGVENALNALRNNSDNQISGNLSDFSGLVTGNYLVDNLYSYNLFLREGETAHLDLTGFNGAEVTIAWTKKTDASENLTCDTDERSGGSPAAIEISEFRGSNHVVYRSYYNSASCGSGYANGFSASSDGGSYLSQITYPVDVSATALRIRTIYSGATVLATGNFGSTQLYKIQSRASGGDAQQEIEVNRGLDAPASIFDFAIFTTGTIIK